MLVNLLVVAAVLAVPTLKHLPVVVLLKSNLVEKKKFPFKYGQKVCHKESKKHGYIRSHGPATLGKKGSTRIPDGPIVFEELVLVEVKIQGKYYICIERIDTLQPC